MSRLPRTETLLVLACAGASAMLVASQFTTMFEATPPGGEAITVVEADDQHGPAMAILGVFSLALLVAAIAAPRTDDRSEPLSLFQVAAMSVCICGVVALLFFLVQDLPDANKVGTLDDESFIDAKLEPQAGFWLELAGALVLTVCGGALATIGPARMIDRDRRGREPGADGAVASGSSSGPDESEAERAGGDGFNWPSRTKR